MAFIYITTNLINGKKYIGQSTLNSKDNNYLGSGHVLKRAIKKYGGKSFNREVIYEGDINQVLLDELEIHYINLHNAAYSDKYYNIATGGLGGNGGVPPCKIGAYDENGKFIKNYYSRRSASNDLNIPVTTIRNSLLKKSYTQSKYYFTKEDYFDLDETYNDKYDPTVYLYNNKRELEISCKSSELLSLFNINNLQRNNAIARRYKCTYRGYFISLKENDPLTTAFIDSKTILRLNKQLEIIDEFIFIAYSEKPWSYFKTPYSTYRKALRNKTYVKKTDSYFVRKSDILIFKEGLKNTNYVK